MSLLLNLGNSITAGTDPYQFYNFRERVLADGATILSDTQVSDEIKRLRSLGLYSKFSALYTPAVRNTSKLYSIISADGDATVTRGSVKNINTATGTLEEIASDVTPSSFGTGGWGAYVSGTLINVFRDSEPATDPGQGTRTAVTFAANDWGIGLAGKVIFGDNSTARIYTNSIAITGGGVTVSASFIIKPDNGILPAFGTGSAQIGSLLLANAARATPSVYNVTDIGNGLFFVTWLGAVNETSVLGLNGINKATTNNNVGFEISAIVIAETNIRLSLNDYIKTTGSAFTRSADVITKTGASDLIGQTEGTLFAVVDTGIQNDVRIFATVDSSATVQRITLETGTGNLRFRVRQGGSFVNINIAMLSSGVYKIVGIYNGANMSFYVNGQLVNTATIDPLLNPNTNEIMIGHISGSNQLNDRILLAGISKTALTQAEAIALTT